MLQSVVLLLHICEWVMMSVHAGKLTSEQIRAGYMALKKIEDCLKKKGRNHELLEACNQFYTRIPHDFGWAACGRAVETMRDHWKMKKNKQSSKTINVRLNTLFSSLKTPPIIRTEDELKQKIALLEVWSVIASTEF